MSTYTGTAHGGPLDGQTLDSRFPKGVLVVNKPGNHCWLYERTLGNFVVRDPDGEPWDRERSRTAADGVDYDVRALDVTP